MDGCTWQLKRQNVFPGRIQSSLTQLEVELGEDFFVNDRERNIVRFLAYIYWLLWTPTPRKVSEKRSSKKDKNCASQDQAVQATGIELTSCQAPLMELESIPENTCPVQRDLDSEEGTLHSSFYSATLTSEKAMLD